MRSILFFMLLAVLTVPISPLQAVAQEAEEAAEAEGPDIIGPVMDGNVRAVSSAIDDGADPNEADDGLPVLVYAALQGQTDIVTALIEAGANVNATGPSEATALMYAAAGGHMEVLQALIEAATSTTAGPRLEKPSRPGLTSMQPTALVGRL